MNKQCTKCKIEKTFDQFYKDKNRKDGIRSECKDCFNEYQKHSNQKQMKVKNKRTKESIQFSTLIDLSEQMRELRKATECKQHSVTVNPPDPSKWVGIACFGDLHWGDFYQDIDTLMEHTTKVLEADNVIAIQVGDILNNQASLTHRGTKREQPFEFDLASQRKAAKQWFRMIGSKMAAFIIGNHDARSIISEGLDIGEIVVEEVKGAYLGAKGDFVLEFNEDHSYFIRLVHGDRIGYSMWNPNHPGARILSKRPYLDIIVHGHIHAGVAIQELPIYDDKVAFLVRSAGYGFDQEILSSLGIPSSHFNWKIGEGTETPATPIILLNPNKKEILAYSDLDRGLQILKFLNNWESI